MTLGTGYTELDGHAHDAGDDVYAVVTKHHGGGGRQGYGQLPGFMVGYISLFMNYSIFTKLFFVPSTFKVSFSLFDIKKN